MNKTTITALIILLLIGAGAYLLFSKEDSSNKAGENIDFATGEAEDVTKETDPTSLDEKEGESVLGTSIENRDIVAYHYGEGDTELLFIGGIHGGYSWNTALVAYELMDYLENNPNKIPDNLKVTVVPVMNPDGLHKVVGTTESFSPSSVPSSASIKREGRFNARGVDLNRNFDCDWQSEGTWQNTSVSGGDKAFSEAESLALKSYIENENPEAVVVWYSAAGGVFASSCHNSVSSETVALTNLYADASGYTSYEEFDFYEITGDMVNWLAKKNITAISVLLSNHEDVEWNKNRKGVEAILEYYAE